jgi:HSP20 family protein
MTSWGRDYFDSIFEEMSREIREMERMFDRILRSARSLPPGTVITEGPYYYGFSITVGPDGKPIVREFGNVRPSALGQLTVGAREPLIETVVDDKENVVKIAAEMPGVTKEDINITVSEDKVIISAEHGNKKYYTEVPLSVAVDPNSAEASYNNGILEVRLKTKEPVKNKGVQIKVK